MSPWRLRDQAALAARRVVASAKSAIGVLDSGLSAVRRADPVLLYHRVLADQADTATIDPGMYVRASTFERHLDLLQSRWTVGTLSEILAEERGDSPRVAITFDDGWRDNLEIAWPILKRRGVRATVFLIKDSCETGTGPQGIFMRPSEILDLAREGMEFGAHTVSHPFLDTLDPERAREEMVASRDAVSAWTGLPCRLFAYPFGRRTREIEEIAASLFDASVIVGGGWWRRHGDRARIPRIAIHDDMTCTRALFEERLVDALEVDS